MHRLYLYDHYRLTVADPRSMAVDAAAGNSGDGGPTGGDLATNITPANLVLTPAQRRDGPLMALIRSLAVGFPGLAHLVGGTAPRPGTRLSSGRSSVDHRRPSATFDGPPRPATSSLDPRRPAP
jgi:hypothetical protein